MGDYQSDNVFAKILRGEIPSARIHEDETCLAIMDAMPQSEGHCLVIPKAASRNLLDASDKTLAAVMPVVARLARATKAALDADGVRIAQFNEAPAGQSVFHLHFHVIPVYEGVELRQHSGSMADPELLKDQADRIRAAFTQS